MRLFYLPVMLALCVNCFASDKQPIQSDSAVNLAPCVLDVGWTDWKPFQYLSDENRAAGLTIDLLDLVAKEMQCQFIYHQNDWLTSVQLIKNGKLDFVGSASVTKKRRKFAFFSKPYYQELLVLYVRGKDIKVYGVSSLAELFNSHDFKLGMVSGAKFDRQLTLLQTKPQFKAQFIYADSSYKLFEMLNSGVIDGYFADPLIMDELVTNSTHGVLIESYPLEIKTGSLHFMFSKKRTNTTRLQKFNDALIRVLNKNPAKFDWFLQE